MASTTSRSRLPTPTSSAFKISHGLDEPSDYRSSAAGASRSNTLPSIRSLRKAFQFTGNNGSQKRASTSEPGVKYIPQSKLHGSSNITYREGIKTGSLPKSQSVTSLQSFTGPAGSRVASAPSGLPRPPRSMPTSANASPIACSSPFTTARDGVPANEDSPASSSPVASGRRRSSSASVRVPVPRLEVEDLLQEQPPKQDASAPGLLELAADDLQQDQILHNDLPAPAAFIAHLREQGTGTPPPVQPLPALPSETLGRSQGLPDEGTVPEGSLYTQEEHVEPAESAREAPASGLTAGQPTEGRVVSYTFPYDTHMLATSRQTKEQTQQPTNLAIDVATPTKIRSTSIQSGLSLAPEPIIMDSPSKSPAITDAERRFDFMVAETAIISEFSEAPNLIRSNVEPSDREGTRSNTSRQTSLEKATALDNLRRSASSPLSELVARLSAHASPDKHDTCPDGTTLEYSPQRMLARQLHENEEDNSTEAGHELIAWQADPQSIFGNRVSTHEDADVLASADGSSGISEAAPGPRKSVDLTSLLASAPSEAGIITEEPEAMTPPTTTREEPMPIRTLPSDAEKRWSIQEVEEAYSRMKGLYGARRPSNTGSAAMSLSPTENSMSMDTSYIRQLLEAGSGTSLDSSAQSIKHLESTHADEVADRLSPLNLQRRPSPSFPGRLSPRSPSPHAQSPSLGRSQRLTDHHQPSEDSPHSSMDTYSTNGPSTGASGLTPATSVESSDNSGKRQLERGSVSRRLPSRVDVAAPTAHDSRLNARRGSERASIATSAAGSDETGWQTPKTSMPDAISRRHSRSSGAGDRRISLPRNLDNTDIIPHGNAYASRTSRRPVSYSNSSTSVESHGQYNVRRSASVRNNGTGTLSTQSSSWFNDTPRTVRARPGIPNDFRDMHSNHAHRREDSNNSVATSVTAADSTTAWSEAKKADKIDLFLRCTKAEAALSSLTTQAMNEKEALLDALQESRQAVEDVRQQREDLVDEIESMRVTSGRRDPETARQIAEIVEARDTWQARAQAAERELESMRRRSKVSEEDSQAKINQLMKQVSTLQEQIAAQAAKQARPLSKSGTPSMPSLASRSRLPASASSPRLPSSSSKSMLPSRSPPTNIRTRNISSSSSTGLPVLSRHGRATSTASTAFETDFGDHLPAASDGWSANDSQDISLRLDEQTAKFLQDIEPNEIVLRR